MTGAFRMSDYITRSDLKQGYLRNTTIDIPKILHKDANETVGTSGDLVYDVFTQGIFSSVEALSSTFVDFNEELTLGEWLHFSHLEENPSM